MKRFWPPIVGAVVFVAIVGWFYWPRNPDKLHAKPRKEWKEGAIPAIAARANDAKWLATEIEQVKAQITAERDAEGNWFSPNILLMENGDWMVYDAKCAKEDRRIHDIFLGRSSDGRWHYSTYHFCVRMLELRVADQPKDLDDFIRRFSVRQFDGRSDECLKKTWPPSQ